MVSPPPPSWLLTYSRQCFWVTFSDSGANGGRGWGWRYLCVVAQMLLHGELTVPFGGQYQVCYVGVLGWSSSLPGVLSDTKLIPTPLFGNIGVGRASPGRYSRIVHLNMLEGEIKEQAQ